VLPLAERTNWLKLDQLPNGGCAWRTVCSEVWAGGNPGPQSPRATTETTLPSAAYGPGDLRPDTWVTSLRDGGQKLNAIFALGLLEYFHARPIQPPWCSYGPPLAAVRYASTLTSTSYSRLLCSLADLHAAVIPRSPERIEGVNIHSLAKAATPDGRAIADHVAQSCTEHLVW